MEAKYSKTWYTKQTQNFSELNQVQLLELDETKMQKKLLSSLVGSLSYYRQNHQHYLKKAMHLEKIGLYNVYPTHTPPQIITEKIPDPQNQKKMANIASKWINPYQIRNKDALIQGVTWRWSSGDW